jgi:hypothetical protein
LPGGIIWSLLSGCVALPSWCLVVCTSWGNVIGWAFWGGPPQLGHCH